MTVAIETVDKATAAALISSSNVHKLGEDEIEKFDRYLKATLVIWAGVRNNQPVNLWGVIPPTMLADVAYLWHYLLAPAEEHTFVLARHSRLAVERVLKHYPRLVGHCRMGDDEAQKWIRWLGGEFGYPSGDLIPFTITAKAST